MEPHEMRKLELERWDTPETRRLRWFMVEQQIVQRGVRDPRVLEALRTVPRHVFVAEEEQYAAYDDHPLSIGFGQTISQPYIVALMTEALQLRGDEKVLEVGTGSGYQAAILALLARSVHTIERISQLASHAAACLSRLGFENVNVTCQDGSLGLPEEAPFDAIVVTAAAPEPPPALLEQLADGGKLVVPTGEREDQSLLKVTRMGDTFAQENLGLCAFVPLIGRGGWRDSSGSTL